MTVLKKMTLISLAVLFLGAPQKLNALPYVGILPEWTLGERLADRMAPFPPLPADFREGQIFDKQKVLNAISTRDNHWYQVPDWLAGEFAYDQMTVDYNKDLLSGKIDDTETVIPAAKSGRHRGILRDKKNRIWQLSKGSEVADASNAVNNEGHHRIENATVGLISSPKEYVEVSESVDFNVDATGKIAKVTRLKRWRDFYIGDKNRVFFMMQEMRFNADGKPIFLTKVNGSVRRLQAFEALTSANERSKGEYDEKVAQLRAFLKSQNKAEDAL